MNQEEAILELKKLEQSKDNEKAHGRADDILIAYLESIGDGQKSVADAYTSLSHKVSFWYA